MTNVKNFSLDKFGFGDVLATYYCLENLGRQKKLHFNLKVKDERIELFNQFHFQFIHLTNSNSISFIDLVKSENGNPPCDNLLLHNSLATIPHLVNRHAISLISCYLTDKYGYNHTQAYPLIPKNTIKKEKLILTQFDGRTTARQNRDIPNYAKLALIKHHAREKEWACIGGKDTPNYFGDKIKYIRLNIQGLISHMQMCEMFIGCDSGMSHLAGVLGVPAKIYIMGQCFACLKQYYSGYQNCEVKYPRAKMV